MSHDEEVRYRRRAEAHVERARRAIDPRIVSFHYAMTEHYLDKLYPPAPQDLTNG